MITEAIAMIALVLGAYASARCIVLAKCTRGLAETQSRSLSLIAHLQKSAAQMDEYGRLMKTLSHDMASTRATADAALRTALESRDRDEGKQP